MAAPPGRGETGRLFGLIGYEMMLPELDVGRSGVLGLVSMIGS